MLEVLRRIQSETGFNPKGRKDDKKGKTSDFQRNRKKIAVQIKNIRKSLDDRDELLGKKAATKSTVILSADIRHQIKMVKKDAAAMQSAQQKRTELLKKKAKKGVLSEDAQNEIEAMSEVVDLAWKHIEECELLE